VAVGERGGNAAFVARLSQVERCWARAWSAVVDDTRVGGATFPDVINDERVKPPGDTRGERLV
jgi:hypothetical protein